MIMNSPSHRILLASVNPCYPSFGIIHLVFGITQLDENGWQLAQRWRTQEPDPQQYFLIKDMHDDRQADTPAPRARA